MWLLAGTGTSAGQETAWAAFLKQHLPLHWIGLGMLIATVVTWLAFRWRNSRLSRRLHSPRQLLRELCRLHEIHWGDRRLLMLMARKHKIGDAARLFVEAALWKQVIEGERLPGNRRRLVVLQKKLLTV